MRSPRHIFQKSAQVLVVAVAFLVAVEGLLVLLPIIAVEYVLFTKHPIAGAWGRFFDAVIDRMDTMYAEAAR